MISRFDRGETPLTPSYQDSKVDVGIKSAIAGINSEQAIYSYDSNELSEWKNDGKLSTAWITYHLERKAEIDDICIKLTGWRKRSYPLEIFADDKLVWSGNTEKSLGYIHLSVKPVQNHCRRVEDCFCPCAGPVSPLPGHHPLFHEYFHLPTACSRIRGTDCRWDCR